MAEDVVAWVFPGQGAQQVGMGRDLYEGCEAARRLFEQADDVLGYRLSQICFEGPEEVLRETEQAQPALFTTSLACLEAARVLGGLTDEAPAFVAGHSLGEYTALVAAGALSFEEGLRLVQERARLTQLAGQENPGAMAAILGLDEAAVADICQQAGAELCNLNAPGQIVIGGAAEAVETAQKLALERGAHRGVRLNVSGAFHTSLMAPAAEGMAQAVAATPLRDPQVPIVANTTGQPLARADDLRRELAEQLIRPVRWQASVEYILAQGVTQFIEFGPGRVLSGLIRRIDRSAAVTNVSDLVLARQAATTPAPP